MAKTVPGVPVRAASSPDDDLLKRLSEIDPTAPLDPNAEPVEQPLVQPYNMPDIVQSTFAINLNKYLDEQIQSTIPQGFSINDKGLKIARNALYPTFGSGTINNQGVYSPYAEENGPPIKTGDEWNYIEANKSEFQLGRSGEVLPNRALAWDAAGRPYFGDGISGVVEKTRSNMEAIWTDPEASVLGKAGETLKSFTVDYLLGLFDVVGKAGKEYIGPYLVAQKEVAEESELPSAFGVDEETGKERTLSDAIDDAFKGDDGFAEKVHNVLGTDANTWIKSVVNSVDFISAGWNAVRVMSTSPSRETQLDALDDAQKAAKISATAWIDEATKEEYIRRVESGENPTLLATELGDPIAEIAWEIVFDGLNLFGAAVKPFATFNSIKRARAGYSAIHGMEGYADAVRALEAVQNTADVVKVESAIDNVWSVVSKKVTDIRAGLDDYRKLPSGLPDLFKDTQTGKRAKTLQEIQPVIQRILATSDNVDDAMDTLKALTSISREGADSKDLFRAWSKITGSKASDIIMSENGLKLGAILDDIAKDGKRLTEILEMEKDVERISEMSKFVTGKLDNMFPTVTEAMSKAKKAGEVLDIPRWVQTFSKVNHTAQTKFFGPVKNFFSGLYMGPANVGFGIRNIINNKLTIFADNGFGVFRSVGGHTDNIGKWIGDFYTPRGFQAMGADIAEKGFWQKYFSKTVAGWGEETSGTIAISKALDEVMPPMLREAFPSQDKLIRWGMNADDAKHARKFFVENRGDIAHLTDALKNNGFLDTSSSLAFLEKADAEWLQQHNMYDKILDIAKKNADAGLTRQDTIRDIDKLAEEMVEAGKKFSLESIIDDGSEVHPEFGAALIECQMTKDLRAITVDLTRNMKAHNRFANNQLDKWVVEVEQTLMNAAKNLNMEQQAELAELMKRALFQHKQYTGGANPLYSWGELNKGTLKSEGMFMNKMDTIMKNFFDDAHALSNPRFLKNGEWVSRSGNDLRVWRDGFATEMMGKYKTATKEEGLWMALQEFGMKGDFSDKYSVRDIYNMYWENFANPYALNINMAEREVYSLIGQDYANDLLKIGEKYGIKYEGQLGVNYQDALKDARFYDGAFYEGNTIVSYGHGQAATRELVAKGLNRLKIPSAIEKGDAVIANPHAINALNKQFETMEGMEKIKHLNDIKFEDLEKVEEALNNIAKEKGFDNIKLILDEEYTQAERVKDLGLGSIDETLSAEKFKTVYPPIEPNNQMLPSPAAVTYQAIPGMEDVLNRVRMGIGRQQSLSIPMEIQDELVEIAKRVESAKGAGYAMAVEKRNFTLLAYDQTKNFDAVLSMVYPWHFWYGRTVTNWGKRMATNPGMIAGYAMYRDAMEKVHADMPDWYKYQITTNDLFGKNAKDPMFFNLESVLNPLYGVTKEDFNDPVKRNNWFTAFADDLGKIGPSINPIYGLAIALGLSQQGEEEAAARWGGTGFIPHFKVTRAIDSMFGDDPLEQWDPAINFFSGGMDPYEQRRVGRALYKFAEDGKYPAEEISEAARLQSGPIWDEAVLFAVNQNANGQLASFFLGVGFKGRTISDVELDKFYQDSHTLFAMKDMYSPEQYREAWTQLNQQYPFSDIVAISNSTGIKRDDQYTYHVLDRVPPGYTDDIFEMVGLSYDFVEKFYEEKGLKNFSESDYNRFVAGIVDIGAILEIPEASVKAEWDAVSKHSSEINTLLDNIFGDDIGDKTDIFFDYLSYDQLKADQFKAQYPEIEQAQDLRSQLIMQNPMVNAYYGGVDVIDRYYTNEMYSQLKKTFGEDIFDIQTTYWTLKDQSNDAAKAYLAEHPELKGYWEMKEALEPGITEKIVALGTLLPEKKGPFTRGNEPESFGQEQLIQEMQGMSAQAIPYEAYESIFQPEGIALLLNGGALPEELQDLLLEFESQYGLTQEQIVQGIVQSLQN